MVCGCCVHKLKGELFKPHRERGCTDVVCLLLLIVAVGGLVVITYVAISAHPSLVDDLLYPTDSYGNNCGKLGTATSELSKVLYPDLDSDIVTHAGLIATGQYLTFFTSVTRLCAHACPAGVSLRGPSIYGGSDYPGGANATVPEHTYAFMTQDVFGRCFPLTSAFSEATSQLCAQPACTDQALNATLGGTVRCAALSDRPEETTTWELCAAGTAACGRRRLGRATIRCTGCLLGCPLAAVCTRNAPPSRSMGGCGAASQRVADSSCSLTRRSNTRHGGGAVRYAAGRVPVLRAARAAGAVPARRRERRQHGRHQGARFQGQAVGRRGRWRARGEGSQYSW